MSYRIDYSPIAIRDLDRVFAEVYEASKNEEIDAQYVIDLMDCVSKKHEFPKPGPPLYYESGFTEYYFAVIKVYMAFYRIREDRMLVDHVVYGKSDYMRTIFRNADQ